MNKKIPQYHIDSRKEVQDRFILYVKECTDNSRPVSADPHSHNYYCLSFLYKGVLSDYVDLTHHVLQAPAVLPQNVDQVHIHSDLKNCKIVSIAFAPEFLYGQDKRLRMCMETVFAQTSIVLSDHELRELDTYIQLIIINEKHGKQELDVIKCLLNILLIKCADFIKASEKHDSGNRDLFKDFQQLLKEHFRNHHQVKFYADALYITTAVLVKTVKKACCKSPKEIIDERLITEAKRLLYWSDITVREVAWELGFETDSYFNKFFKKFTGTTPKLYQKEMLKKNKS